MVLADLNLITDRTQQDVDRWAELKAKGWQAMTDDEKAEWQTALKGSYNYTDMNRVENAVEYVANRLSAAGCVINPTVKKNWSGADIPTKSDLDRYMRNVADIRSALSVLSATPETPESMALLTWSTANDIEKILADVDWLIDQMKANVNVGWANGTAHTGLYAAKPTAKLLSESGAILVDDLENAPDLLSLPDGSGSTVLVESGGANYLYEVT